MKRINRSSRVSLGIVGNLLLLFLIPDLSLGAGRRRATLPREFSQDPSLGSPTGRARRVLDLQPVPSVTVELPDGEQAQLGAPFELSVIDQLHQTGKYLVLNHLPDPLISQSRFALSVETPEEKSVEPGWFWFSSNTPTATIDLEIKEVSFVAGNRGDKIFYGFSEALELPTDVPTDGLKDEQGEKVRRVINEFPPADLPWFGSTFSRKGTSPFDSASGLELGEGFSIFYGYGTVGLKYARYSAKVIVEARVRAPLAHDFQELKRIEAKGEGFYFDLAVSYDGFKASLGAARKTAMQDAIKNALNAVAPALARSTQDLPLVGRVDYVTPEGVLLLGTGIGSQIPPGTRYVIVDASGHRTQPGFVVVKTSEMSGAIGAYLPEDPLPSTTSTATTATATSTTATQPKVGDLLRQYTPTWDDGLPQLRQKQAAAVLLSQVKASDGADEATGVGVQAQALQIVSPPDEVFESIAVPPLELDPNRAGASGRRITRSAWAEVLSLLTLPYRIWRYFQYDKPYPSHRLTSFYTASALKKQQELLKWIRGAADFPVKLQVPDSSSPAGGGGPLVAVLDSGVDYLHPGISPSIAALNLGAPEKIQPSEQVGWDFVSMDPRPFDDHYHGTQVASLIAAVAPQAQILPVKVFSPYGTTSSAALYSGFSYALKRGARIIVCAWGTAVESTVIKQAIREAKKQGVWVVAPLSRKEANEFPALFASTEENLLVIEGDARRLRVAEPRKQKTEASHFSLNAGILAGAVARSLDGRQESDAPSVPSRSELVQRLKALGLQTSADRFHF